MYPAPLVERVPSVVAARVAGGEVVAVVWAAVDSTDSVVGDEPVVLSFGLTAEVAHALLGEGLPRCLLVQPASSWPGVFGAAWARGAGRAALEARR